MALRPKQIVFANEYLVDFNATRAAKAAGYSEKSASVIAEENLRKPEIKKYIEEELENRAKSSRITVKKIEDEIAKVAFIPLEDFILWYGKGIKMKVADKMKALELLCRMKGVFNEKGINPKDMSKEELKTFLTEWLKENGSKPRTISR